MSPHCIRLQIRGARSHITTSFVWDRQIIRKDQQVHSKWNYNHSLGQSLVRSQKSVFTRTFCKLLFFLKVRVEMKYIYDWKFLSYTLRRRHRATFNSHLRLCMSEETWVRWYSDKSFVKVALQFQEVIGSQCKLQWAHRLFNHLTPMCDHDRFSPYVINTISTR